MTAYDAVIVGSGPNGLAAAITLAQTGRRVMLMEAKDTLGGGMRTLELTLPGFRHDMCSAVHALGAASPFFRSLPLAQYGLEWVYPEIEAAHPLDDSPALLIQRSVIATAAQFGRDDATYQRVMTPLVNNYQRILDQFLGPFKLPYHPIMMAYFGTQALLPARTWLSLMFRQPQARAAFAGMAAHSIQPLERPITASFGLMLMLLAHAVGWPLARGGSQHLANALAAHLRVLGGEIVTDAEVKSMADVPAARTYLFDLTPRQLLNIAGDHFTVGYRRQLERYRYGPGVFKIDYALSAPIPWRDPAIGRAGTVHLGGTVEEISVSERAMWQGQHAERPYVLVVQPTAVDPSRAPEGKHIGWAYCHVPHGSTHDMTAQIEGQIERFAPGFRDVVLARRTHHAQEMQHYNANYIGGDINGGVQDLRQLFTRPAIRLNPYTTPAKNIFICSSSTPPGGGVHGMSGYYAAQAALKQLN